MGFLLLLEINLFTFVETKKMINMDSIKLTYCSREEASILWRCSIKTIDRNIRDGRIKCRKLDSAKGGRVLIYIDSLFENNPRQN